MFFQHNYSPCFSPENRLGTLKYNVPVIFLWPVWMRNSLAQKHHSLYFRAEKERGQTFQKEAEGFLISPPSTLSWP